MLFLTEEIVKSEEKLNDFILEALSSKIPKDLSKKLSKIDVRRDLKEKYGKDAFLKPSELKYPVINPDSGEYDCRLIYAARVRALQYKEQEITDKAEKLFTFNQCNEKLDIKIHDDDSESHDLLDLILVNS